MEELNINPRFIHRMRELHRSRAHSLPKLKTDLQDVLLIVHWDRKLMEDITGKRQVDRLPIIVSGNGSSQLLCC